MPHTSSLDVLNIAERWQNVKTEKAAHRAAGKWQCTREQQVANTDQSQLSCTMASKQGEKKLRLASFASFDKQIGEHTACGGERMTVKESCGTSYRGCYHGAMAHGTHIIGPASQGFNGQQQSPCKGWQCLEED